MPSSIRAGIQYAYTITTPSKIENDCFLSQDDPIFDPFLYRTTPNRLFPEFPYKEILKITIIPEKN